VYVYTLVPLQVSGDGLSTVDVSTGVIAFPHASFTIGVVGGMANAGQLTVDPASAGAVKGGTIIV
jgi:hypothetical protein